jgi:hypothetical protein
MTDIATTIHNERAKLRANFLNGLALIFFSVGVLAPVISSVYFTGISHDKAFLAVATAFICFIASIILHYVAWWHLTDLVQ